LHQDRAETLILICQAGWKMNNKPETWARAERLIFAGEREEALGMQLNKELGDPFSGSESLSQVGQTRGLMGVAREGAYWLPRILKTV
jgi:hypothetical protein